MWDEIRQALAAHQQDENSSQEVKPEDETLSAVIVPLFLARNKLGVLFIERSERVGLHRGQIGFPGGMMEDKDRGDPVRTALRETEEEIGLFPDMITILGRLKTRRTDTTGITVTPFVASIPFPYTFSPDPVEIKGMHTGLLETVRDTESGQGNPFELPPPVYTIDEKPVWGLTAAIFTELLEVLAPVFREG